MFKTDDPYAGGIRRTRSRLSWHEDSVFEFFFKSRRLKKAPARLELATFLMARRRRVAVLVDDSPGSMRACRYGAKHLLDKNTDVMLVTAVHDSHDPRAVRRSVYERAYASETPKGDGVLMFVVDRSDVCVQDGWFFFFFFFRDVARWVAATQLPTIAPLIDVVPLVASVSLKKKKLKTQGGSSEGERVCDHHAAQLVRCRLPPERIQKVIVPIKKKARETVAQAALRAARGADHLVMGTRGVGAVQGAVMRAVGLGGVSHDVVRQSRVPVTVVPITAPVPEMIAVRDGGERREF